MIRKMLISLTLAAVGVGATSSPAFLNAGCTATTETGVSLANKTASQENGTIDAVGSKKIDVFTISFSEPGDHYLAVFPVAADLDIRVCKRKADGTYSLVCDSHNLVGAPDGCLLTDPDLNGANPGIGKELSGAGTYKLFIFNCSSISGCSDLENAAAANYVAVWK